MSVLLVVAFFTISEARRTNEQTREMLTRYDEAISGYFTDKTNAIDAAVSSGVSSIEKKAKSLTLEDLKRISESLRKPEQPK